MTRDRLYTSFFSVLATMSVASGLAVSNSTHNHPPPPPPPPPSQCELYPIAVSAKSIANAKPGQVIPDILNGTKPGNFGWLTWNGDQSATSLAKSLTPPGDAYRYVNPLKASDHEVSIGDHVLGRTGVVNSSSVRDALDKLKKLDIRVPIWNEVSAWAFQTNGSKVKYRVSGFARVRILDYRLPSQSRITVRFLGLDNCAPPQQRPPVATDASAQTPEETPKELTLTASDPDGDPLTFSVISGPAHGSLGAVAGNRVTYTPASDYNGPDAFTFKANDGSADSNVATFTLTVTPVNDAPVCRDLSVGTPFETPVETDPDCVDVDGDVLTYEIAVQGAKGTASVAAGRLRYVPGTGQTGTDSFKYRARDGVTASNDANVAVTIGAHGNRPPIARDDLLETPEDTIGSVNVLANDSDPDGDALAVVSWTQPAHGTATCVSLGSCTYTPAADYNGADSFRYTIDDGHGGTAEATVRITVTPVNDSPSAQDATAETAEDTSKELTLPADDPDGDTLAYSIVNAPNHGVLGAIVQGKVTYTPAADYFGPDSFSFRVSDGQAQSQTATVALTVTEVNDVPSGKADELAVGVSEPTVIPAPVVLHNDSTGPPNESGQPLEVVAVAATPSTHGVVTFADDQITYTPDPGFSGDATIGYTVCDRGTTHGTLDPQCAADGVVKLAVTAADRPPVADPQQLTTAEDVEQSVTLTGSDPDGDPLTFEIDRPPAHGSLIGTAPILAYRPAADYNGPDEFTFTITDGRARSEPATISLTVTEVNDPPVLGADSAVLGGAAALPPVPPRPNCPKPCGVIYGDPHLATFDAALYDFQAVGEFIGAKSTTDDFELQARLAAVPRLRTVSIAVAVAMRVAGHRVAVYRTLTGADTRIDGVLTTVTAAPKPLPGGGTIGTYGRPNEITVVWPDGSVAIIAAVGIFPEYYRFTVNLGLASPRLTHMIGVLGNADGSPANDIVRRDGVQLPYPDPPFNQVYPAYADSWRISQAESLFDYGPGETTETYTDRTFPDAPATPSSLPPAVRTAAAAQCGTFGVVVPAMLDACTVDVGLTSDPEFASSSAAAQQTTFGIPDNTGVASIGQATPVVIGTPGENAVRTFAATAGQKITMTLSGNDIAAVDLTIRQPNGTFVGSQFLSGPGVFHDVMTLPVIGTYSVTIDPRDQNTGRLTFRLDSVPDNVGTTAIGQDTTVTTTTAGENPVRTFAATAGQKITMTLSANTIAAVDVTIRQPNGTFVGSQFLSGPGVFHDVMTLPVTGTYSVTIDPRDQDTGRLTFRVDSVPDNVGTTAIGVPTTVTTTVAGENAVRTFAATAGQKITMTLSGNDIAAVDVIIRQPNGTFVGSQFLSGLGVFHDVMTLPVTGTYSVTIDPRDQNTGHITFRLDPVPDNTGTTAIGVPTTVTTTVAGENPVRTFAATAGQKITMTVSGNDIAAVDLTIRQPNGTFVGSQFLSGLGVFHDVMTLPVTGTYSVTIDPRDQNTGHITFRLDPVPDNTGTTAIGVPTTVTTTVAGENPVRTFAATAGQKITMTVSGNDIAAVDLTIRQPNGTFVGSQFVSGPSAFHDMMTLPVTGTYTITIDPREQNTGQLTFTLTAVTGIAALKPLEDLDAFQADLRKETAAEPAAAAAADPPVLALSVAEVLANDRPGPANESDQTLAVTAVNTTPFSHGTVTLAGGTITYTPDEGFNGLAAIAYTACDDGTTNGLPDPRCSTGTITIKVTANHPPTAVSRQIETAEDVAAAVLLAGADEDGDSVAFRIVDVPSHGVLSGTAPNLTYTPAPDFHGTDSFVYATNDTHDESAPASVAITVSEVNDPPSPQPDSITGGVGRSVSVATTTLRANDVPGPFDERGQVLAITAVAATADTHGTVSFADGAVTYVPDAGFAGTAKVLYTACDDGTTNGQPDPRCADGQLSIVANLAPTATAKTATTLRNTAVTIALAGSDPENDLLTFAIAAPPAHGTLTGTGDSRVYTPEAGFAGSDSFTFTVADAYSTSATATVSIDVAATPPPIIRPDAAATTNNTSVLIDVLANDTAAAGSIDPATLAVVVPPTNGTAIVEGSSIRYTPAPGVTPDDRFTYRVCDTFGVCGQAEVTVSATVPNRPPVAQPDSYQVTKGATLDVAAPGLLTNDSDPDPGDAIQARLGTGVSAGNLLIRADGSFRYTPSPAFPGGIDSFTYFVVDRAGLQSAPVTVTIDVVPPGPLAVDDHYTTTKDNPLIVMPAGVLANDRDAHSTDVLTARLERAPGRGTVDLNPDGSFVYTPDAGLTGQDVFRYVVSNVPGLVSEFAFVTIDVTAPTVPVPTVACATPADGAKVTAPAAVTANVAPPTGETISSWKVTARNQDRGTPVVLASGTGQPPATLATFDPTLLVNGAYQLLISADSSGGGNATAACNVFVTGEMKLGDYQTTYLDLETSIAGFPVQVLRTYDTTDKRGGDFGIGWRVELAGPRATPNNRLGQGGWITEPFGFPFTRFRFKTSVPHFVTVTSPGGRVEVFDFIPAPSGPLLSLTTPGFVARPGTGTTSKLEDADPPTLSLAGASLADFFGGTIYDPRLFRLTTRDGDVMIIDRFDGLKSITDRNGNALTFSPDGVQSASTDRHLTLVRDGAGRIMEIRGPAEKRTQYTYTAAGDLRTFVAANGGVDTFSYDGGHRLLTADGPGGIRLRTLSYGPDGRFKSLTDATGNTTELSADVNASSEIVTSPSGRLTTISKYGADGNLASKEEVFSAHSRVTRFEYDTEGRLTRTIAPLGRVETLTHDAAGNITSRTTPKNEKWSYAFNALNQPTTTTAPDGTVIESLTYDANGNVTSGAFSDGASVAFTNDSRGLPLTATDSFGTTSYAYDGDQQLTAITDPAGGITRKTYDVAGRVTSVETPAGEITRFTRNALDLVVEQIVPNGSKYSMVYDVFGRLTSLTDTAGRTTSYEYDNAGRRVESLDRAGQTTRYGYDRDGNLSGVTYADGDVSTGVSDPVGRLVSLSDADTIVEFAYNDANDLVSERTRGNNGVPLPDVTFSYTTDPDGQRTSLAGPGGAVAYGYDTRGHLSSVRDGASRMFSLAYDSTGRLTGHTRPNGVRDSLGYRENRLVQRNATLGGSILGKAEYALDALGRRTSLTDLDGGHSFGYDLADRLTGALHPPASALPAESFTYDTMGNRTSWVGSPSGSVRYDAGMQLLSDGTYDYSYDGEGRVTERRNRATSGITRYVWNSAGQLTSITAPDGTVSRYRYDPMGRRLEADDNGSVRRFAWSGWNLQNEFDGANGLRATYVTGPLSTDTVYEVVRGGTPYYPLYDGLDSVTALTDAAGAVVGRTRYPAFGAPQSSGITDDGFTFTGHQYDRATGLVYARARYFDPAIGRFLSQDPDPAVNPYPYASNAPLDFTDPSGRQSLVERMWEWIRVRVFGLTPKKVLLSKAAYEAAKAAKDEAARLANEAARLANQIEVIWTGPTSKGGWGK